VRRISGGLGRLVELIDGMAERPIVAQSGRIVEIAPTHVRLAGLSHCVALGDRVSIGSPPGRHLAEVIHVDENIATATPFASDQVTSLGDDAVLVGPGGIAPDSTWKGRMINALGQPMDDKGALAPGARWHSSERRPPQPARRQRLKTPLKTGVRAVDIFTPLCVGQRIGIFAGSGVGKSTLLGMLIQAAEVDTIVVGLVGERGREVRELVEDTLGPRFVRSIAVVSTSDESPLMRRLAPLTAMSIAEYFRDRGENVLLVVDSITRYAHALRDVALAAGEPPVARGYTPSVFTALARYLERAGTGEEGTGAITALISVLVDGDDHNDPIADSVRGILDGHVILSRRIAELGRYPAIDLLASISRLADAVWTPDQRKAVQRLRAMIARFEETRDLRQIGAYQAGSDGELDGIVATVPRIYDVLNQDRAVVSKDAFADLTRALGA